MSVCLPLLLEQGAGCIGEKLGQNYSKSACG